LDAFVLLFDGDDDPVVKDIKYLMRINRDFVEQEQRMRLQLVQTEVEVALFSKQQLCRGRLKLHKVQRLCQVRVHLCDHLRRHLIQDGTFAAPVRRVLQVRDIPFREPVEQAHRINILVDNEASHHRYDRLEPEELIYDQMARVSAQVVHLKGDPASLHEAFPLSHALTFALHNHLPQIMRQNVHSVKQLVSSRRVAPQLGKLRSKAVITLTELINSLLLTRLPHQILNVSLLVVIEIAEDRLPLQSEQVEVLHACAVVLGEDACPPLRFLVVADLVDALLHQ